jgi:hypothetical protein
MPEPAGPGILIGNFREQLRKNYFLSFLGFFVSFFWFMPLAID